jgi:hypothetical protein
MVAGAAFLGGCGGGGGSGPSNADSGSVDDAGNGQAEAAGADAGNGQAEAAGADANGNVYPAFTVDAPQIEKNQGTVLTKPVVVTVTWPGDTNASTWEAFGDSIGASSYWAATTAPYGVGPATSGASNHVRMTQPLPASVSFYDLENFVIAAVQAAQSDGGAPNMGLPDASAPNAGVPDGSSLDGSSLDGSSLDGSSLDGSSLDAGAPNPSWPLPTLDGSGHSQTIYSLFIAPSTTETDPGSGTSFCSLGGYGYHDAVTVGATSVVFTVVLECTQQQTTAELEESATHEDVEAATNPYVTSTTMMGYKGFDAMHAAWDVYTGYNDELADACENWADSYYQESVAFPYWAQRSWSNTAALAGHDPCVPAPAGPYHGMTLFPSQESTVRVDQSSLGGPASDTRAFEATLGQPLTFQVGYFSDGNAPPWTIAYDFPSALFNTVGRSVSNGRANVAIDKTSGQNGDRANVTVTVTAKGASGFHVMAITWDPPTSGPYLPHYLPLLIVDE